MLNALTNSDFWLYLLLPVFLWTRYVDFILSVVTQRSYLLSQLKNHALIVEMSGNVFSIPFPPIPNGSFPFPFSIPGLARFIPIPSRSHSRTASSISSDNK